MYSENAIGVGLSLKQIILWRRGKSPHRWKSRRAGERALRYLAWGEFDSNILPTARAVGYDLSPASRAMMLSG